MYPLEKEISLIPRKISTLIVDPWLDWIFLGISIFYNSIGILSFLLSNTKSFVEFFMLIGKYSFV